jgi:hypothetical protein
MRARGFDDEHSAADAVALAEIGEVMRRQARNRGLSRTAQGVAGERTVLASEAGPRAKLRKA